MEKYPRGRRGSPAKGVGRVTVARVQIPLSPPNKNPPKRVDFLFGGETDFSQPSDEVARAATATAAGGR